VAASENRRREAWALASFAWYTAKRDSLAEAAGYNNCLTLHEDAGRRWLKDLGGVGKMTKIRVLLGTLLVCGLFGCSQDPNEAAVSETIAALRDTTTIIEQITTTVKGEVEAAKKSNGKMDVVKLADANTKAKELKGQAERLQKIKATIDNLREGLNKEQRAALADKHKGSFQDAANALNKAERDLDKVMKDADEQAKAEDAKAAMKTLRETLVNSQKEFAVLTKKQV
jgi:hypothetical protein